MKPGPIVTDHDLNEYIDGRLSAERRREVEAWLRTHPEGAARLRILRELDGQLRGLGADVLQEPVPERLSQAFQAPAAAARPRGEPKRRGRRRRGGTLWLQGAAACLIFVIGAGSGWMARSGLFEQQASELDQLLADATYAFTFYVADREHSIEFAPDELETLTNANASLYEAAIEPPDLAPIGYTFRGARISPAGRQTGTFFFFEGEDGSDIGLVFWRSETMASSGIGSTGVDDLNCWYWFVSGFGFALLGPSDADALEEVANELAAFYDELLKSG
jgi:anti-sigma factor RsiW